MKQSGHPVWYDEAKVSCVCGNAFTTGSTLPEIRVDICAACHPFYTGTQKLNDTQGQVEKFTKSMATAQAKKQEKAQIIENRASKVEKSNSDKPTLKDLLLQARKANA